MNLKNTVSRGKKSRNTKYRISELEISAFEKTNPGLGIQRPEKYQIFAKKNAEISNPSRMIFGFSEFLLTPTLSEFLYIIQLLFKNITRKFRIFFCEIS